MWIRTQQHARTYVHLHVYACVMFDYRTSAHITHKHTHTYMNTDTQTQTHTHARAHTHTHTHSRTPSCHSHNCGHISKSCKMFSKASLFKIRSPFSVRVRLLNGHHFFPCKQIDQMRQTTTHHTPHTNKRTSNHTHINTHKYRPPPCKHQRAS